MKTINSLKIKNANPSKSKPKAQLLAKTKTKRQLKKPFFCISYYEGDLSWVRKFCKNNYIIYNKSGKDLPEKFNVINVPNVGYNIYSYLKFIIDNYNCLPDYIIFCKNNVFDRHVSYEYFKQASTRRVFTPFFDPQKHFQIKFPVSMISSCGTYLEINNSWYTKKYTSKYFSSFNNFFEFIFKLSYNIKYVSFAPGANYLVPRDNILLRSKFFYINLMVFVGHSRDSTESHYVERALTSIWSSQINTSNVMNRQLSERDIKLLEKKCTNHLTAKRYFFAALKRWFF